MTKEKLEVADNIVVSLDYVLRLDDGREIDRSDAGDPLEFLQGHGNIIPGLEKELYGLAIGDSKQVAVSPSEGYGDFDPDELETVSRSTFPADMDLVVGMTLQMREATTNQVFTATIAEIEGDDITLDFNHPLAGETLNFDVTIADLRPATEDEVAHGHAHSN